MLQVFVSHNIRIRNAPVPMKATITKDLAYPNPAYEKAKRIGKRGWGIPQKLELYIYDRGDLVVPRGYLDDVINLLVKFNYDPHLVIHVQQTDGQKVDFGPWNGSFILRKYQTPFIQAALEKNGIGVAPAGSGKTIMGLRYVHDKGVPAVWLTHTTDLMYQTAAKAEKLLKGVGKIGFFGDGKHEWGDGKLIIATVQTLQQNQHLIDAMNEFVGTVVIDEAHHFPAVQFVETAGRFKAKNMLGVTATPERKDGLQFYMYRGVGPIVYKVDRSDLYDNGELIKPQVRFIYTKFEDEYASDRNEIDSVDAGGDDMDYTAVIQSLIQDEKRARLIAENIVEHYPLGPAIVITESVRYCFILEKLVKELMQERYGPTYYGKPYQTAVVHGGISRYKWLSKMPPTHLILETKVTKSGPRYKVENYSEEEMKAWQVSSKQRKAIMEAADRKEVDILFATQLAREGLDMPHLTVGHMAMPKRGDGRDSKNGAAVEQEIGRIMRADPANPDKKAYWFDYVDYNVGVFKDQYYSRRKVYKRLGIPLPKKQKTERESIDEFLGSNMMFDFPY